MSKCGIFLKGWPNVPGLDLNLEKPSISGRHLGSGIRVELALRSSKFRCSGRTVNGRPLFLKRFAGTCLLLSSKPLPPSRGRKGVESSEG